MSSEQNNCGSCRKGCAITRGTSSVNTGGHTAYDRECNWKSWVLELLRGDGAACRKHVPFVEGTRMSPVLLFEGPLRSCGGASALKRWQGSPFPPCLCAMFRITKTLGKNRYRVELTELLSCGGHWLWWALALETGQLRQGRVGRWGRGRFDSSLLEKKWGHWVSG